MKNFKSAALFLGLFSVLFLFNSCNTKSSLDNTYPYAIGLKYTVKDDESDYDKIMAYISTKKVNDLIGKALSYTANSQKEANTIAINNFNQLVSDLSIEEVAALGLNPESTFGIYLYQNKYDAITVGPVIASWVYILPQ